MTDQNMRGFIWNTAGPKERADMVRRHTYSLRGKFGKERICELYNLTEAGLEAILNGGDWSHDCEPPDVNYI